LGRRSLEPGRSCRIVPEKPIVANVAPGPVEIPVPQLALSGTARRVVSGSAWQRAGALTDDDLDGQRGSLQCRHGGRTLTSDNCHSRK
jgi:hypothetical protein